MRLRPHPRFRLEGRDLRVDVPVTPWEAALGAVVPVPTLTGTVQVRVPAGSSTGRRLRVRGRGMPDRSGGRGDLYADLRVVVPKDPGERERELFLIAHGLVEPDPATQEARLYRREAAIQVARAARLQRDLGLNEAGAVLACELLSRIQELEDRLAAHGLS